MMIFFPLLDELPQVAGMFRVAHRRADLHELFDRLLDLVVENPAVRHHDHGIENLLVVSLQADELVRQPGDGIGFAAAGGVLDEIPPARAVRRDVRQCLPHHVKLVITREHLLALLLARSSCAFPRRSARSFRGCSSGRAA